MQNEWIKGLLILAEKVPLVAKSEWSQVSELVGYAKSAASFINETPPQG